MGLLEDIPFVEARWYTSAQGRKIKLLVLHDMEAPEKPTTAEAVANYFKTTSTKASAHVNIDNNSMVRSVRDKDVAYAAPGANSQGLHIEHAGYAAQRREQWLDVYSHAMLLLSAKLAKAWCDKYSIPIQFVNAAGLLAGKSGITTHAEVSKAWRKTDHTDPGVGFPMDYYIELVKAAGGTDVGTPKPEPTGGGVVVVNAQQVTILSHPSWNGGYIQIHADGGVVNHGGAPFYGSLGGLQLAAPVVDADVTPTGLGYTMLGSDGGIFDFGDAGEVFEGGHGPEPENAPFVSITITPTGKGYLLGGKDGSVWAFGDAKFIARTEWRG